MVIMLTSAIICFEETNFIPCHVIHHMARLTDIEIVDSDEKVFSILKGHFMCSQLSSLQDYIEMGVMLDFNNDFSCLLC